MNDTMRALSESRPPSLDRAPRPTDSAFFTINPRKSSQTGQLSRRLILAGATVAAASVITVAIAARPTSTPTAPSAAPSTRSAAAPAVGSPDNILLVAATQNDRAKIEQGRYWVVRRTVGDGRQAMTDEQWLATGPDDASAAFVRPPAGPWGARALEGHTSENNFLLGGRTVSIAELNALPTDPGALRAKLLTWHEQESEQAFLFYSGAALVLNLPAPAPVRAAAYRMLAAIPGIAALGGVTDALGRAGIAVSYARRGDSGVVGEQHLIIDAATGRALAQESWTGGKRLSYTAIIKAEFSDGPIPDATSLN